MMASTQDAINNLQTQTLDVIKGSQEAIANAVQAWSEAMANVVSTPQQLRALAPAAVANRVEDPAALVDSLYDFAGELLVLNRQFVHRLLQAAETAPAKQATKGAAK
jgi:hypothetical protein